VSEFAVPLVKTKEGIENEFTPVIESANFDGTILNPVGIEENFQIYFTSVVKEEKLIVSELVPEQISCDDLLSGLIDGAGNIVKEKLFVSPIQLAAEEVTE
jgi:hypothetical protein